MTVQKRETRAAIVVRISPLIDYRPPARTRGDRDAAIRQSVVAESVQNGGAAEEFCSATRLIYL